MLHQRYAWVYIFKQCGAGWLLLAAGIPRADDSAVGIWLLHRYNNTDIN